MLTGPAPHLGPDDVEEAAGRAAAGDVAQAAEARPTDRGSRWTPDGRLRALDARYIPLERLVGLILTAIVSILLLAGIVGAWLGALAPGWLVVAMTLVWPILTLALGWWLYRWAEIDYRHTAWAVDADGIEIRKGVVWRRVINVPRSRVQHTDVSQGPLQRRYGLGTLVIYTAGTDHAQVDLSGLDHAIALGVRDHLLPRERVDAV